MRISVCTFCTLCAAFPARARYEPLPEWWGRFTVSFQQSAKLRHDVELQYRRQLTSRFSPGRFDLYTLRWYIHFTRPGFFVQLSPFTFFYRKPFGAQAVGEFRCMQLIGKDFYKNRFQIRTGLEQRFFRSADGHFEELRWRTRLLFSAPLTSNISMNISDEIFLHERLSGSGIKLFDQNRLNLSATVKFKNIVLEPGYSLQTRLVQPNRPDHFNVVYCYVTLQRKNKASS